MITHHPAAPLGSVLILPSYTPSTFSLSSAILCRNTFPLISFAYTLLTRQLPCRVLGREIGAGLLALIDKLNPSSIDALEEKLEIYRDREVSKALSKHDESAADAINDRVKCIEVFISQLKEDNRTLLALKSSITNLFSDEAAPNKITLSTIHKSKGLEYPTIFILDRDLMPSKYAKSGWQLAQEQNLAYVAVTRAQLNLFYITSGRWKKMESVKLITQPNYILD